MSSSETEEPTIEPTGPPPSYMDSADKLQPLQDFDKGAPVQKQPAGPNSPSQPCDYLSVLRGVTGFVIEQKIHLLDVAIGWNSKCKFAVRNQSGDNIFYVEEFSNICCRQCFRLINAFRLEFKDRDGRDVLVIERGLNCSCCFGLVCPDTIRVSTADGDPIGTVKELPHIFHPNYQVEDSVGNKMLLVEGPLLPMLCTLCRGTISFKVKDWKRSEVGGISKDWTDFPQEFFSNADNYSISFAADLEPSTKCLLLAALFLINYEFYEAESAGVGCYLAGLRLSCVTNWFK